MQGAWCGVWGVGCGVWGVGCGVRGVGSIVNPQPSTLNPQPSIAPEEDVEGGWALMEADSCDRLGLLVAEGTIRFDCTRPD